MYTEKYHRIPKAVHHQCMWIVRDIDRLYRLDAIYRHGNRDDELVFYEDENCRCIRYEVMREASGKLDCIKLKYSYYDSITATVNMIGFMVDFKPEHGEGVRLFEVDGFEEFLELSDKLVQE